MSTHVLFALKVITIAKGLMARLVDAYVKHVRPAVVAWRVQNNNQYTGSPVPFLIPPRGMRAFKVSQAIISFFAKYTKLHINTNTLRSVLEKTMKKAIETGLVTSGERIAATRTIGHTEKTRDRCYDPADRYLACNIQYYTILYNITLLSLVPYSYILVCSYFPLVF